MNLALLAGAVLLGSLGGACDKRKEPAPASVGSAGPNDLPDPLNLDWQSLRYDLGSLGSVQATRGRAEFHVVEDDHGVLHATQDPGAGGTMGFLDLDPPALVDLDGDRHEEAVIPFELRSTSDSVFGAFVFTLSNGVPVRLGTITTTAKPGFTVAGATIRTTEGVVWAWDKATKQLVKR
ncbi:MAG: hypothetical protein H0T46_15110 [Deltaproteobacteria bacterium]|nr:hypothetical protein [Deltaproteobacteria bacterium]